MKDGNKCASCTMRFSGKGAYQRYQKHYADKHFKSKSKKNKSRTYKKPGFTQRN